MKSLYCVAVLLRVYPPHRFAKYGDYVVVFTKTKCKNV